MRSRFPRFLRVLRPLGLYHGLMSTTAVHLSLHHANPPSERVIVCDDQLNLAETAQIIDAAFGLSGQARCLFVRPAAPPLTSESVVYTAFPEEASGERSLPQTALVDAFGPLNRDVEYHYGHSTDWVITLTPLGPSTLTAGAGSPPAHLVTATGPDAAEEYESPRLMSLARDRLIMALAGVGETRVDTADPAVALARLSTCDESAVARRVSHCLDGA